MLPATYVVVVMVVPVGSLVLGLGVVILSLVPFPLTSLLFITVLYLLLHYLCAFIVVS